MKYVIVFATVALFALWDIIYGEGRWLRYFFVQIGNLLRSIGLG